MWTSRVRRRRQMYPLRTNIRRGISVVMGGNLDNLAKTRSPRSHGALTLQSTVEGRLMALEISREAMSRRLQQALEERDAALLEVRRLSTQVRSAQDKE